ncbi:Abi family protein [bacterium]|nr:Abi family protein [bacterium]
MIFKKAPKTIPELLDLQQKRGLKISSLDEASSFFKQVGYYRLSGYILPFLEKQQRPHHKYIKNCNFEQIKRLYLLDQKLKAILLKPILNIEVSFRSNLIDTLSLKYGSHWYTDESHFGRRFDIKQSSNYRHSILLDQIKKSDDVFLKHYRKKYESPINPPVWMAFETLSFGEISILFAHLKKRQITMVSQNLGYSPYILISWIHAFSQLRNLCCHNSRLWNRKLTHSLKVKDTVISSCSTQANQLSHYVLAMTDYSKKQNLDLSWKEDLLAHINNFQKSNLPSCIEDEFQKSILHDL